MDTVFLKSLIELTTYVQKKLAEDLREELSHFLDKVEEHGFLVCHLYDTNAWYTVLEVREALARNEPPWNSLEDYAMCDPAKVERRLQQAYETADMELYSFQRRIAMTKPACEE